MVYIPLVVLNTAATYKCFSTSLVTHILTLPLQSIVVQDICFVPRICMNMLWSKLVGIWNRPGIVDLSWIPIKSYSVLIFNRMQIFLACMDIISRLIPPLFRVASVTQSHFQTVLFYGNQSYRQRHPSQLCKQKLLI